MIEAVVFDFDGLILDTEMPSYLSWAEVFRSVGLDHTEDDHVTTIGSNFDRMEQLRQRATGTLPPDDELRAIKDKRHRELLSGMEILPGVRDWLDEADRLGLGLAIASSSPSSWVLEHLDAYGLTPRFAHVVCCENGIERKPAPDSYRIACERLGVAPASALAVEDSANGVAAAKAAGLWCVAVPNALTKRLDFSAADVRVASLADISLAEVCDRLDAG